MGAHAAAAPQVNYPVVIYHIFRDHEDDFTRDWAEAKATYARWVREGSPRVRLYYEAFESEEGYCDDEVMEENGVRFFGGYPY